MAAFYKRCNFVQAGKDDDIADREYISAIALIESLTQVHDLWDENEVDRERWLRKFDAGKRARMEQAWADIPDATKRDIRNKTIMVKIEPLLKRGDTAWGPRAVYVGSDAHNALTGPGMMVAMERLVELTDCLNGGQMVGPVNVKFGYKTEDTTLMAHLVSDPTCTNPLEGDFSRNDREQRSRMADITSCWLRKLNFASWFIKCEHDSSEEYDIYLPAAGLKATANWCKPTGHTATTFGNCGINLIMFAVACLQNNVTKAMALILGDDIVAQTLQVMPLKEWTACVDRFKMVLKAFAPDLEGGATFLSRRFFTYNDVPCMVPKIGKALARFNVRACKNEAVTDDAYMAGKALSYGYEFRHVPTFREYFMRRHKYHWDKLSNEQRTRVAPSEQSWNTRVAGLDDMDKLLRAIKLERVLISEDYLRDWCVDTYGLGLVDMRELFELFIAGHEYIVTDLPAFDNLAIDF